MTRCVWIAVAAVFIAGCNSSPQPLSAENTVGGASVAGFTQVPMAQATTSLTLDWGKKGKAGQVAIADVLSFNGSKPKITAPDGWRFIRDDASASTRQSLYWHAIQANDPSAATWTFDTPVDTKGAIVLLDNAAPDSPVDMSSGKTDTSGTLDAKSVVTTADGDLILLFYATDFHIPGLAPKLPPRHENGDRPGRCVARILDTRGLSGVKMEPPTTFPSARGSSSVGPPLRSRLSGCSDSFAKLI